MVLTSNILKRALLIIQARGWTYQYSAGRSGPLNIRSAVSAACSDLCENSEWHDAYLRAVHAVATTTGECVDHWEFGAASAKRPRRKQAEVEQLLTRVIERCVSHEAQAPHGRYLGRSGVSSRSV